MKKSFCAIPMSLENSRQYHFMAGVSNGVACTVAIHSYRWADKSLASEFARCFNYSNGKRAINFFEGFRSLRMCLGDQFDWAFGMVSSDVFKRKIGKAVAEKVKRFLGGEPDDGVRVMKRVCAHGHCHLVEVAPSNRHECYGCSLVVSTGETSRHFVGTPICVRFDVEEPADGFSMLNLKRVLLSTEEGASICGLASIGDFISNLHNARSALVAGLGVGYDVLKANEMLFETWAWHDDNTGKDEFCVDLSGCDTNGCPVSVCFSRRNGFAAWDLALEADGCRKPFGQLAAHQSFAVDVIAASRMVQFATRQLAKMSTEDIRAAIEYEHCFADHRNRFGEEFGKQIDANPEAAIEVFADEVVAAVERLKRDPQSWLPALSLAGNERRLGLGGEKAEVRIQLLAPLYLTHTDKENLTPTVYLCTGVDGNAVNAATIFFPSVLEVSAAESDHRFFRKIVRLALTVDGGFAEAV